MRLTDLASLGFFGFMSAYCLPYPDDANQIAARLRLNVEVLPWLALCFESVDLTWASVISILTRRSKIRGARTETLHCCREILTRSVSEDRGCGPRLRFGVVREPTAWSVVARHSTGAEPLGRKKGTEGFNPPRRFPGRPPEKGTPEKGTERIK
jgi:hypothetical protein